MNKDLIESVFNLGKHIFVIEDWLGIPRYRTCDNLNELLNIKKYERLIAFSKKHKDVLDAYLLDNSVNIEYLHDSMVGTENWCFANGTQEGKTEKNLTYDFIKEYSEFNEYRLKPQRYKASKEEIKSKPQTIKAPNSDEEFLKPKEFEVEFLKGLDGSIYSIVATENIGNETVFKSGFYTHDGHFYYSCENGITRDERFNLTSYKKPLEWYEDANNLNKLLYCKEMDKMYFFTGFLDGLVYINDTEDHFLIKDVRLATNEEIDSLKIKEN